MRRRDRLTVLLLALLLVSLGAVLYLMTEAPPTPVRFLPRSSGIVYIDLRPIRAAGFFEHNAVHPEDDYQQFINATGIDFERDMDEAAFALNEIPTDQPGQRRISFSEVFVGRFDAGRVSAYLSRTAAEKEHYAGHEIFNIQLPGHTDRVSILGKDTVAVSSALGADEIHAMIDHSRQSMLAMLPMEEDSLVRKYYSRVPMASPVWAVLRLKSFPQDDGLDLRHLSGYGFLLPPDTIVVASSRYVGSVQVRAEAFTQTPADAQKITSTLQTLFSLVRGSKPQTSNSDMATLLDTIKIEQQDSRAVLTATLPNELLKSLFSGKGQ